MANVTRNPDNSFLVVLTPKELRVLGRWAKESTRSRVSVLEQALTQLIESKRVEFRSTDWPTMRDRYDALSAEDQAKIDALLGL